MADEPMTPNGASGFDPIASYARLSERVEGQGKDIVDLRSNMNTGFQTLTASVNTLSNETRSAIASLTSSIAERSRPNIQAYGFMLSVALAVGALAWWPIRESTGDLKQAVADTNQAIQALAASTVSRQEMDWRASRGTEDRDRTTTLLTDLRETTVTRNEWSERNRARDQEVADLSRRIEEIRAILGSQYTTRDVLLELQAEVKELRRRRASRTSPTVE